MELTEQDRNDFRAEVRLWFKENTPEDPGFVLPQTFMEVGTDQQFEFLRNWQRKVYEAGYLGMAWPVEYGGGGKPQVLQDIVTEEMIRAKTPLIMNTIGLNWAGPLILAKGSEAQKKAYIKNILTAEDIWCQGFSEPDNGSDLGNAQLKAERDGDEYVLNGSKIWTTHGSYAKYMILLARTNPQANNKYEGLSFFLSPMQVEGIKTVPIKKLTGEYGFTQTFFDDARIPADCIMGSEGEGWKMAMLTLTFERGAAGGQAGGVAILYASVQEVVDMAKKVQRNGRPAVEDPVLRDQLVRLLMDEKALSLGGIRAGMAPLDSERPLALPLSEKLQGSELQRRLADVAVQLQGANMAYYMGDSEAAENGRWQRSYFNAFSATIGGGTSQIQKNIIGERVLGLPKA
ncbi:MAG: acyl-CoA dehydrogenase [Rhodobacteraceae bacterium]|nr:acyl-CoA dehydrogenase [Paracoccaceae bacterium]